MTADTSAWRIHTRECIGVTIKARRTVRSLNTGDAFTRNTDGATSTRETVLVWTLLTGHTFVTHARHFTHPIGHVANLPFGASRGWTALTAHPFGFNANRRTARAPALTWVTAETVWYTVIRLTCRARGTALLGTRQQTNISTIKLRTLGTVAAGTRTEASITNTASIYAFPGGGIANETRRARFTRANFAGTVDWYAQPDSGAAREANGTYIVVLTRSKTIGAFIERFTNCARSQ